MVAQAKTRLNREVAQSYAVEAVAVNLFYVSVNNAGVRIAFAERYEGAEPNFRQAVLMTVGDALELADVLKRVIGESTT